MCLAKTCCKLRFMASAGQVERSVTLLQFRRVIPASAWLRASIIWADDLAAIWPTGDQPTPFDHAQEQSLQEIAQLQNARLFMPHHIFYLGGIENVASMLKELPRTSTRASFSKTWQDDGSAVGPTPVTSNRPPFEYSPETFVYPNKLPNLLTEALIERNIIRPSGMGYVVSSADILDDLLAAHAIALHKISYGRVVPDIEEPAQARRIAAPSGAGKTHQALVLALRGAITPDLQTDFRRFIDFRLKKSNERARKDYIEQLTGLWNLCARGGTKHARTETIRRVTTDLRKARKSYFKRVDAQMLVAQGLASLGVVIPLQAAHPAAAVVGALATVGASATTIAVRKGAPKYIRNASRSELLAPVGSI